MNRFLIVVLLGISISAFSQSLQEINYNYLYSPGHEYTFSMEPVRKANDWYILYRISISDTTKSLGDFQIQFQTRESLSTNESSPITLNSPDITRTKYGWHGSFVLSAAESKPFLVAKVINLPMKKAWLHYRKLDPKSTTTSYLMSGTSPIVENYIATGSNASFADSARVSVSFYDEEFPAAAPGFSEKLARVPKSFIADSVFSIDAPSFTFFKDGLYLFQRDTTSSEGLAIRAESDYPKLTNPANLAGPFIYICTKSEYNQLEQSKGNKKAFDRTVLTITGDVGRAKNLIRNYYRRVELANQYFTSYKEGWKTDRGMIYIIFGLPDQVFKFEDREVWTFQSKAKPTTFTFVHSPTVFDPDNFVLIRSERYTERWYEAVDLWRNSRY